MPRAVQQADLYARASSFMATAAAAACWACALAATTAGCGGGGGDGPDAMPAVSVTLGTGRTQFEPLENGSTIGLVKGIQGGWHVWTSFLAYGFDTDVLRMEVTTRWEGVDESAIARGGNVSVESTLDVTGAAALRSVGWPAIIFNPICAQGRLLHVDITVRDINGRTASDTRQWIMEVPEADRSGGCGS